MDIEQFREYCLAKPYTSEALPFGDDTLVFRVGSKLFALCDINRFESINLKCEPERAIELREEYSGILPGYHMNKKHWNTVRTDGSVPLALLTELIDHSYQLVYDSLTKAERTKLTL